LAQQCEHALLLGDSLDRAADGQPGSDVISPRDADGIDRATQMVVHIRFDGQCFAIRELEARDVHRQTGRVRADLAGLCVVAVATRSRVNRLEFDRELASNERSDEIAQPMAEPLLWAGRGAVRTAPIPFRRAGLIECRNHRHMILVYQVIARRPHDETSLSMLF
jgi:hypothetical protein